MLPHRMCHRSKLVKRFILVSLYCYCSTITATPLTPTISSDQANIENNQLSLNTLSAPYLYMGGELGINHYQHGCESWRLDCDKNATMAGFFVGYQFNHYFALEAAYIDLGEAEAIYLENGKNQTYIGTMQGINLSAITLMAIRSDLNLFAKVGVFNWHGQNKGPFSEIKADDWAPSVGIGLNYQLSDSWLLRLQYEYFHNLGNDDIGEANAHTTSLGISYQFGWTRPEIITKTITNTFTDTVKTPPEIELEQITFPILFDFNSSKILFLDSLEIIIKRLTRYPEANVILQGYTDSDGSEEYNLALASHRTDSIRQHLIKSGVKQQQIIIENYGEQYSKNNLLTEDQKYLNRRVQVLLPAMKLKPQEQK